MQRQILVLVGVVTLLSAFVKNVGALAIMMPIAFQLARRTGTSPSSLLMPMAFGSLLGGLMTLIGTSPNIIVARMRAELLGEPFHMFDFLPVGAGIAAVGVGFLVFGYRLLPSGRKGSASIEAAFNIEGYTTEATLPDGSPLAGKPVAELEAMGGRRGHRQRDHPRSLAPLRAGLLFDPAGGRRAASCRPTPPRSSGWWHVAGSSWRPRR